MQINRDRHRYRCRRRQSIPKTNPCAFSFYTVLLHVGRTVNGAFTILIKANRVFIMGFIAKLALCGFDDGTAFEFGDNFKE